MAEHGCQSQYALAPSNTKVEFRLRQRAGREQLARRVAKAVEREADRRIRRRVRVGIQRITEVARDYGYRDGSGVHRVIQRLEAKAQSDRKLQSRLDAWRRELSRVKTWTPSRPRVRTHRIPCKGGPTRLTGPI